LSASVWHILTWRAIPGGPYYQEFERCRIVDKHMTILARKYFDTRFLKCHAPDLPFFVSKLNIQVAGALRTSTRPTFCSDELIPRVCMSNHPEVTSISRAQISVCKVPV